MLDVYDVPIRCRNFGDESRNSTVISGDADFTPILTSNHLETPDTRGETRSAAGNASEVFEIEGERDRWWDVGTRGA